MKISFITPSYNNLEYLKLCHKSLLDNISGIMWEHCIADDGSSDGTTQWLQRMSITDKSIKYITIKNRIGHTELYNTLVDTVSTGNIICIFHADMFLASVNTIRNMVKHLTENIIVSATRVEPIGMYPPSDEKVLIDFGGLNIEDINIMDIKSKILKLETENNNKTISSIFAPWMCYKKDYLPMDTLFSPFPHEDEDVFVRLLLNGCKIVQSMDALVPHFCSRGHRKTDKNNPTADNDEYSYYENKARRNYIRKWHSWVKFEEYQCPIIPKVYNIGLVVKNCNEQLLVALEPWFSTVYVDCPIDNYIKTSQLTTAFDLTQRVKNINVKKTNDIVIEFDAMLLNQDKFLFLTNQLPDVIAESGEVGQLEYDIFKFTINRIEPLQNRLISIKDTYYTGQLT